MTHYLRNQHGHNIVDAESTKDDLHVLIDVEYFSNFLLQQKHSFLQWKLIKDFKEIQEIRGEWFEKQIYSSVFKSTKDLMETRLKELGKKWGLKYVTD